jgi:hypothetical protein
VIYLAEIRSCLPLFDPRHLVLEFKHVVESYPPRLQKKLVSDSLWTAEFTFFHATGFAERGDIFNTVGCLARIAFMLAQCLFALNAEYYFGDKGASKRSTISLESPTDFPDDSRPSWRFQRQTHASSSPPFTKCTFYGKKSSI